MKSNINYKTYNFDLVIPILLVIQFIMLVLHYSTLVVLPLWLVYLPFMVLAGIIIMAVMFMLLGIYLVSRR